MMPNLNLKGIESAAIYHRVCKYRFLSNIGNFKLFSSVTPFHSWTFLTTKVFFLLTGNLCVSHLDYIFPGIPGLCWHKRENMKHRDEQSTS